MKVEVIRAFGMYRVGDVLEPAALLRGEWMRRGWVKPKTDAIEQHEAVVVDSPAADPVRVSRRRRQS